MRRKAARKRSHAGFPVHGFSSLLADVATIRRNTAALARSFEASYLLCPAQLLS